MALTKANIIEAIYKEMGGNGIDRNSCSEQLETGAIQKSYTS